ncbi:MAG TPA: PQQ-binding-like beta-propeller repeat protein [Pyrinomonadaceae bacterium]|nr:PQQ-binding-like beta-propeller repeat protein [Pyrinomonadaceae bacterium]
MKVAVLLLCLLSLFAASTSAQTVWNTPLDSKIRFYQTTDFGVVLAATERSLYAIDSESGQRIWRRETGGISETSITPVPETDLILFSRDLGSKSRVEAVDVLAGSSLWQSDKLKGDVMQLAVDPANDLLAVVMVKNARGEGSLKRKPVLHVLQMSSGDELWKRDFDNEIEMMPSRFGEAGGEIDFTLDNYRAPLLLDGRLFLFYEGATSYDARTGKEKEREKFKINEDGLALTEADPVFNDTHVFVSGRGRIRAVNRRTGNVDWKADDLGISAEMAIVGTTLYVRTGGQFTRLRDGELESKGPYGISAIDTTSGKIKWRYKGADKGLTNFVFANANTILIADRDDLITIDANNGKAISKREHKVEKAQFVLINEASQAVVGGRDTLAAMRVGESKGSDIWRVKHKAPARGVLRIVAGVALRAAAIYFRYGGVATSALSIARGGLNLLSAANSLRWSGLKTRFGSFDLTTLASSSAQNYITRRIYAYGSIGRVPNIASRFSGLQITLPTATDIRGQIIGRAVDRVTPSSAEVRESIFDRVDPVRQIERLSSFLLKKQRLAELRANHMYFFTDLPKPYDRKGLVGVNINNGRDSRFVVIGDPDPQFVADEATSTVISADGNRLQAFGIQYR